MSTFVHDYILDRALPDEEETVFTPNGQTTASGIPIGEIKTITRRVVICKRVGPYGGPFVGGGGVSGVGTSTLTVSLAGGGTKSFSKAPGGDTPGEGAWGFEETCDGIADMVLGLYNFTGTFKSEVDETVVGGWAG
ncbi:MAG TPA: hypothetical protein P5318_19465 [Candidatus Hydrogenedentes bacterium]|nr:hypothetical protein [Candidatus Hydrogenedentota bacterium]